MPFTGTILDVSVLLMLVALILMQLTNVIESMVLRFLLMATLLLYHNVKDVVDGTMDGTKNKEQEIQTGKKCIYLLFVIIYSVFCKEALSLY